MSDGSGIAIGLGFILVAGIAVYFIAFHKPGNTYGAVNSNASGSAPPKPQTTAQGVITFGVELMKAWDTYNKPSSNINGSDDLAVPTWA